MMQQGGDQQATRGDEEEKRSQRSQRSEHSDTPDECWICREDGSSEPLIQPCACRGSMSGVHASCVEEWVRHHRQNAINNAAPRCSVCHQPYSGQEVRPGVVGFVRYFGFFGGLLFLRSVVLV